MNRPTHQCIAVNGKYLCCCAPWENGTTCLYFEAETRERRVVCKFQDVPEDEYGPQCSSKDVQLEITLERL